MARKPELDEDLVWVWRGFFRLSSSRHYAGLVIPTKEIKIRYNACPIAISEVFSWLSLNDIRDKEQREDFDYFMQRMDAVFLTKNRSQDK